MDFILLSSKAWFNVGATNLVVLSRHFSTLSVIVNKRSTNNYLYSPYSKYLQSILKVDCSLHWNLIKLKWNLFILLVELILMRNLPSAKTKGTTLITKCKSVIFGVEMAFLVQNMILTIWRNYSNKSFVNMKVFVPSKVILHKQGWSVYRFRSWPWGLRAFAVFAIIRDFPFPLFVLYVFAFMIKKVGTG